MKKLILIAIAVVGLAGLGEQSAQAQTNTPSGSFLGTVQDYFTSFNTNYDATFGAERVTLWTGVDSIQGGATPLANQLGFAYDVYSSTGANGLKTTAVQLENVLRNSGVAGTVVSEQAGLGLSIIVHDVKLTAYADFGYDLQATKDKLYGEVGLRAFKALTEHTFAGVGIAAQVPANRQVLSVFAGFTF